MKRIPKVVTVTCLEIELEEMGVLCLAVLGAGESTRGQDPSGMWLRKFDCLKAPKSAPRQAL